MTETLSLPWFLRYWCEFHSPKEFFVLFGEESLISAGIKDVVLFRNRFCLSGWKTNKQLNKTKKNSKRTESPSGKAFSLSELLPAFYSLSLKGLIARTFFRHCWRQGPWGSESVKTLVSHLNVDCKILHVKSYYLSNVFLVCGYRSDLHCFRPLNSMGLWRLHQDWRCMVGEMVQNS